MNNKDSRDFAIYTAISIVNAAVSFITMIFLTRTTSEAFFGRINLFISAANLVMSFVCFGLDCAYIRFFYETPDSLDEKQLAYICVIPSVIFFVLVTAILFIIQNTQLLINMIGGNGYFYVVAFMLVVIAQYIIRYLTIFFRMKSKVIWFSIVTISSTVLSKTLFLFIHMFTNDFNRCIYLIAVFMFVFSLVFFLVNKKNIIKRASFDFKKNYDIYRFSILSAPGFAIIYLNGYLPQVIIKSNLGEDILGIYGASLLFCSAIQILSTGFTTFWSPYMYKNYKINSSAIKNIHDLVMISMIVVLVGILSVHKILYLFIGESFRKNQNLLGLLLIYPIAVILIETTAYGMNIEKKNEISLTIYFSTTLINVILCAMLSPVFGLDGIAFASMISSVLHFIFMTYWGQKYYISINNAKKTIFNFVILIIVALIFYVFYHNKYIYLSCFLLIFIMMIFINIHTVEWGYEKLKELIKKR